MSPKPLLTVLMPVYNAEITLLSALRSILEQSFKDFEVLLINDGSSDSTLELARCVADDRIRLVSFEENKGLVHCLNYGIDIAKGDFIVRMDADDIAHPRRLELQYREVNLAGLDLCGCAWLEISSKGSHCVRVPPVYHQYPIVLANGSPFAHGSVMIRRSFLIEKGLRYRQQYAEDYRLWLDMYSSGAVIGAVPRVLYYYFVHEQSFSKIKRHEYRTASFELRKLFIQRHGSEIIKSLEMMLKLKLTNDRQVCADIAMVTLVKYADLGVISLARLLGSCGVIPSVKGFRRLAMYKMWILRNSFQRCSA